jgi:hypothetical protein
MNEDAFEGTLILEMLAELGLVDDFYEAIDSDNISRAVSLMRRAQLDEETIAITVRKIQESDGQH